MDRSTSSSDTDLSSHHGPSKARKTRASASAPVRVRRAARACDRCRSSKLRCQAATASDDDKRCGHCAKMDLSCEYSNPLPPHVAAMTTPVAAAGEDRLSQLESNVARLLEMMARERAVVPSVVQPMSTETMGSYQTGVQTHDLDAHDLTAHDLAAHDLAAHDLAAHDLAAHDLAAHDLAAHDPPPPLDSWFSQGTSDHGSPPIPQPMPQPLLPPLTSPRVRFGATGFSISPEALSDAAISHRSTEPPPADFAQARPIPKFGTASRMAAFADPSSHEAPFRPLTYNPDTFRNAEIDESSGVVTEDPSKTPKRGRGDPIDRGIVTEADARALFAFFRDEISFFLPICQEPMTFDFVRHRSSYLLSAVLAIAAKYCCRTTAPPLPDADAWPPSPNMYWRHGIQPVEEETWLRIRALAMSSYIQALISKVHCLEDVQATLLLCAWGLQDRGASPDPWIMAGTAYRLARRLGVHTAVARLASGAVQPTARLVASMKTYLCLYAFDRFLTAGFGRPESEGFEASTIDTCVLMAYLESNDPSLALLCSPESAACVAAYVELGNIARRYSHFVNVALKAEPATCRAEMGDIVGTLDAFSSRWLWARSPLGAKLGLSSRPIKMLYNHIRLCLHLVPLKPVSQPDSLLFLQRTGLAGMLPKCLKKAEDAACSIIQAFADDMREENDAVLCYAYDYAYLVLAHAAAVLLSIATFGVCGVDSVPGCMDRNAAMRYCGTAITSMVELNRSANFFPWDMAVNLSLIAKETGMTVADWASEGVVRTLEARADGDGVAPSLSAPDFVFPDIDMFLQPGLFDSSLFLSDSF